jgi:serine/threonine-protein kinase
MPAPRAKPPPPPRQRHKSWGHRPVEDSAHEVTPGTVIGGKYCLLEVLGEGGMGTVWLARNQALDTEVAIKLLHAGRATPRAYLRLLQEARAAAQLQHPSIVRVFDFGDAEHGAPYIVMEVLSGELLSDLLERKGRLPAPKAVTTLLPVIGAVAVAHAKGIVHRDLKPENVLLVQIDVGSLVPKVLDFGIATFRESQIEGRITMEQTLVGTPAYMSPEQCTWGATVDARTDVWALAVMLYELIAGKLPFDGSTLEAVLTGVMTEEPVPLLDHAAGDAELWEIVRRGLEKDREKRWASAREFGTELAQWARRQGLDSDIAGSSIEAHWLTSNSHMISVPPPPLEPEEAADARQTATTERPDSDPILEPHAVEHTQEPLGSGRKRLGVIAFAAGVAMAAVIIVWFREPLLSRGSQKLGDAPSAAPISSTPIVQASKTAESALESAEPTPSSAPLEPVAADSRATTSPTTTARARQRPRRAPKIPRERTDW